MPAETKPVQTFHLPKTLGACADQLYETRCHRLEVEREAKELCALEAALKEKIIQELPRSEASGVAGKLARVSVSLKEIPQVKDWPKFYAYVSKHKCYELLQRRLSDAAIKERLEAGEKLPGVELFKTPVVSLNKV